MDDDARRQGDASHIQQRAQLDAARARGFPTTADSGGRAEDPDRLGAKALLVIGYVLAAFVLLGAGNSRSASLAVVGTEIIIGLLLLTDAWGLRSRLPVLSSESKIQAAGGWIALTLVALVLRQIAALWS